MIQRKDAEIRQDAKQISVISVPSVVARCFTDLRALALNFPARTQNQTCR